VFKSKIEKEWPKLGFSSNAIVLKTIDEGLIAYKDYTALLPLLDIAKRGSDKIHYGKEPWRKTRTSAKLVRLILRLKRF